LNSDIKLIAKRLNENGYPAFLVGGAVRDSFRGVTPKDYDITTSASPAEIGNLFPGLNFINVGVAFGIIVLCMNGQTYEIAQFRSDGDYSDGRHPNSVKLGVTIEEDLARRDFRMNAIAMDIITQKVVDPFNGQSDIENHVINFVGDPIDRIQEDSLRILRAFRFMSQLGFELGGETLAAINAVFSQKGETIFDGVSQERITAEFSKIMTGDNVFNTIKLMAEIGLLFVIIPEMTALMEPHNNHFHQEILPPFGKSILSHVLLVVKNAAEIKNDFCDQTVFMMAALLHDIGKPACRERKENGEDRFLFHDRKGAEMTRTIMKRMRFPSAIISAVAELVAGHMKVHDLPKFKRPCKVRRLMGRRDFEMLFALGRCDTLGTLHDNDDSLQAVNDAMNIMTGYRDRFPIMLESPIITGLDLIAAGQKSGPLFKKALDVAYDCQLDGETDRRKILNQAISFITTNFQKNH
jgi:putative nucleotidyltransferase with HDIG domain